MSQKTRTVTIYHVGENRPYTVIKDVTRVLESRETLELTTTNGSKYTYILRNTVSIEEEWDENETT